MTAADIPMIPALHDGAWLDGQGRLYSGWSFPVHPRYWHNVLACEMCRAMPCGSACANCGTMSWWRKR